ncbi:hypothetical protein ATANTOWER_024398 [Ataeniobius toweri]|uniref:Uncharacterized protein n=1 Tax=Ataeniobius toweri TaxID=208326 RepID=A0ABU7A8J9_9TELE|nr:hypothetical protein [Ataeniobius toweri]
MEHGLLTLKTGMNFSGTFKTNHMNPLSAQPSERRSPSCLHVTTFSLNKNTLFQHGVLNHMDLKLGSDKRGRVRKCLLAGKKALFNLDPKVTMIRRSNTRLCAFKVK